jgi:hypothetical protein
MPGNHHIRYLKRQEIDIARWDACIAASANRLIYGFSFYLDHMTDGQWDALVLEEYAAIMPLTWRRKAGIRYLCQPAFTQQTGIFSQKSIPPDLVTAFLDQLNRYFRFAEIYLNFSNPSATAEARSNFILSLNAPYTQLSGQYKANLVRDLQLTARTGLNYIKEYDLRVVLDGFHREYADRLPYVREKDYRYFEELCRFLQQRQQVIIRVATGPKQQLLATALLFRDDARMYLLQPVTLPGGRDARAAHFLIDNIVREWAGAPLILDFEGSDLPGVARFYQHFGSNDQPYFFYRKNQLPWPVRLLKK